MKEKVDTDILTMVVNEPHAIILGSPEAKLHQYPNDYEVDRFEDIIKTTNYNIIQPLKKKKGSKNASCGSIDAFMYRLMDTLKDESCIEISDSLDDFQMIQIVKDKGLLSITLQQQCIFSAVLGLIKQKYDNLEIAATHGERVFVSFAELHRALGYEGQIRHEHKEVYRKALRKLTTTYISLDMTNTKYAKYKQQMDKMTIKTRTPLIVYGGEAVFKQKGNRQPKEGMWLHMSIFGEFLLYTLQAYRVDKRVINTGLNKSRLAHKEELLAYIKGHYYNTYGKTNHRVIKVVTILSRLGLEEEYAQTHRKKEFITRKVLNTIKSMDIVKECQMYEKNKEKYLKIVYKDNQ